MRIYSLRCTRKRKRSPHDDRCDDGCGSYCTGEKGEASCKAGLMVDESAISSPIRFFVAGEPVPEGSTKAFVVNGKPCITHGNPNMDKWRQRIATEAQHASEGRWFIPKREGINDGASIEIEFLIPRPKSVREGAQPTKRPDVDKLARAALDALTGVLFDDDSQVLSLSARKVYQAAGSSPGAMVTVSRSEA